MVTVECKDYNNTTYFKFTTSPRVEVEHIFRPDEDIYEAFDILTRLFPDRLKSLNRRKNKYLNYFHKSYLSNDDLILTFCAKDGNNYVCRYDK